MNTTRLCLAVMTMLFCVLLTAGCQKQPRTTADVPRVFSPRYSIAVMPFNQPTESCNLIMGQLPENQGCISVDQLMLLDADLRELLLSRNNGRDYAFETALPPFLATTTNFHASARPQALPQWAKLAKKTGKDFILIPQVLDWHDRAGSKAGVTEAAAVKLEFFLIRTETGTVSKHATFDESQVGLTSNLLTVGDFVKRKGAWVSGRELAMEGMQTMLREMGLY